MATNRVFEVLKCLDRNDRKRFSKFLISPFFNQSKPLIRLGLHFIELADSAAFEFDKETAWNALAPGEISRDVLFRKHCSDLLGLIEQFLVQVTFEKKENSFHTLLLEAITTKKLFPIGNSFSRYGKLKIDSIKELSSNAFYDRFTFEQAYFNYMRFDEKGFEEFNLDDISRNLDYFYWIEKLKIYNTYLSQRNVSRFVYRIEFIEEILTYLSNPMNQPIQPALSIYLKCARLLEDKGNKNELLELKSLLSEFATDFPQHEALNLYESALSYCTWKINQGNKEYYQEIYELYVDALSKEILFVDGELNEWRFGNIVVAAMSVGKLEWAESFIEKFGSRLSSESKNNAIRFNKMRVYMRQRRFSDVLELCSDIEYKDFGYNLINKSAIIMAYYELDEFDSLSSSIESFKVYLNRHKEITPDRKKQFLRFARFAKTLTRILPGDQKLIDKTRLDILENKNTPNSAWLLEKLAELEK